MAGLRIRVVPHVLSYACCPCKALISCFHLSRTVEQAPPGSFAADRTDLSHPAKAFCYLSAWLTLLSPSLDICFAAVPYEVLAIPNAPNHQGIPGSPARSELPPRVTAGCASYMTAPRSAPMSVLHRRARTPPGSFAACRTNLSHPAKAFCYLPM